MFVYLLIFIVLIFIMLTLYKKGKELSKLFIILGAFAAGIAFKLLLKLTDYNILNYKIVGLFLTIYIIYIVMRVMYTKDTVDKQNEIAEFYKKQKDFANGEMHKQYDDINKANNILLGFGILLTIMLSNVSGMHSMSYKLNIASAIVLIFSLYDYLNIQKQIESNRNLMALVRGLFQYNLSLFSHKRLLKIIILGFYAYIAVGLLIYS